MAVARLNFFQKQSLFLIDFEKRVCSLICFVNMEIVIGLTKTLICP